MKRILVLFMIFPWYSGISFMPYHSSILIWTFFMCRIIWFYWCVELSVSIMLSLSSIMWTQYWLWGNSMKVMCSMFSRILHSLSIAMKSIFDLLRIFVSCLIMIVVFEAISVSSFINWDFALIRSINTMKSVLKMSNWENCWRRIITIRNCFH